MARRVALVDGRPDSMGYLCLGRFNLRQACAAWSGIASAAAKRASARLRWRYLSLRRRPKSNTGLSSGDAGLSPLHSLHLYLALGRHTARRGHRGRRFRT
jgi:hypothetical protein